MKQIIFILIFIQVSYSQVLIQSHKKNFEIANQNFLEIEITFHNKSDSIYLIYLQNWRIVKTDVDGFTYGWPNQINLGNRIWIMNKDKKPDLRLAEDNSRGLLLTNSIKPILPNSNFSFVILISDEEIIADFEEQNNIIFYYYSISFLCKSEFNELNKKYKFFFNPSNYFFLPIEYNEAKKDFNVIYKIDKKETTFKLTENEKKIIRELFHFRRIQIFK